MKLSFFIAERFIRSRKYKNSISGMILRTGVIAISLGFIITLVSLSVGTGLQKEVKNKLSTLNGHIQVLNYDSNFSEITKNPLTLNHAIISDLEKQPNISDVNVYATKGGIIRTDHDFEGIISKGVSPNYQWSKIQPYLVEGTLPDPSTGMNNDILISKYIADRLQLSLYDRITILYLKEGQTYPNQRQFNISGIFKTGFKDFDYTYTYIDIKHIQRMNKWTLDQVGGLETRVHDFDYLQATRDYIYKNSPTEWDIRTIVSKYTSIFNWLSLMDYNIYIIFVIIISVSGFNMITVLLVTVIERTPFIGILKAIGASNRLITRIFLINASYLILKGLFWGNLIGLVLLLIQKYFKVIQLNPDTYYIDSVPIFISGVHILLLNLGTFMICVLMLLLPSVIISKISPAKTIRFT